MPTRSGGEGRRLAATLVWNSLGFIELISTIGLNALTGVTQYLLANDLPLFFGIGVLLTLHIVVLGLLLQKSSVDYFRAR